MDIWPVVSNFSLSPSSRLLALSLSLSLSLSRWNRKKLSFKQRRDRVKQKKAAYLKKLQEAND